MPHFKVKFISWILQQVQLRQSRLININIIKLITIRWAWVLVPTKLVEPGNALAWGGGIHSNPARRPPPGTVTLNNSVEYLPTNTYLAHTLKGRVRDGKKPKHKMVRKQQAIGTTLYEELQASNCVYKSQGAPARGISPPLV